MSAERLTLLLSIRARVAVAHQLVATYHDELQRLHDVEMIPISVTLDKKMAASVGEIVSDLDTLIRATTKDLTGDNKVEGPIRGTP